MLLPNPSRLDNWSLTKPELKQHLQGQGRCETRTFLHELWEGEIREVAADKIVLMGLSQGCAARNRVDTSMDGQALYSIGG
jgi:hypothetical protein